ncbi:MAG: hypothetical protein KAY22_19405 [Rhizorhabdus sp.]|jgi:hypothetical protein|uniref:hypothetical protein n=1 Tax=Rhizorhabdus sp. TaxID=1968843 RepID=UPI001B720DB9|nr:hypothetical protein [Rhizorhabdus sp.]MBP8234466.1 hypothetical protein [Rhizorhabdus sp.]
MKPALMLLTLLSPAVAQAAVPAKAKAVEAAGKPAAAAPLPLVPGARKITLSAEGRTIAARVFGEADPRTGQIQAELAQLKQQKLEVVGAASIDVDKLEGVVRKEEALQSELRTRQNDRLLSLLRALPEGDRAALVQALVNPAKPQNSAAAVPAKPAN